MENTVMEQNLQKFEYQSLDEYQNRLKKLQELKALGINPYPYKYDPTHRTIELIDENEKKDVGLSDDAASGSTTFCKIAGRLVLFRAMGKNAFGQIQDEEGRLQVMFNKDLTKVEGYQPKNESDPKAIKIIEKKFDLGDILGIEGHLFRTHKGELTIYVKKATLLCKTLLPLPDKHSGLANKEIIYRKRWLDLVANQRSLETFKMRSKILHIIRKFMQEQNFLEVETPILQHTYGGAEAEPFNTHLNALHQDMFLRIALEIPLKKLLVGGFEKVFEISKVFRNEGLDRTHNPEFTMLEAYAAYWDYNDMMAFTENLYETIALELFGKAEIEWEANNALTTIHLKAPWKRLTVKQSIQEYASIDVDKLSDEQMRKILLEKSSIDPNDIQKATRGNLIQSLFEEFVEDKLIQPHHITDHPIETTPLCKPLRDPQKNSEKLVERFESFILGMEATNAYSELNDPVLQKELLENQALLKKEGKKETHPLDEEFLEALSLGMPPAGGVGIGIDRLVMLFTKNRSIRDVIFFPLMKPD